MTTGKMTGERSLDTGLRDTRLYEILVSLFKGTVSPDILTLFIMSIIKSVLFVWPLIPFSFFYIASLILYLFTKF